MGPFGGAGDPCDAAPTINTDTDDTITNPSCAPDTGWTARSSLSVTGTLGTLEYERYRALDSAGTSWVLWNRTQNLTSNFSQNSPFIGAAEEGCDPLDKWFRSRARVTDPDNGNNPCGAGSWINATQISKLNTNTCPSQC